MEICLELAVAFVLDTTKTMDCQSLDYFHMIYESQHIKKMKCID